MESGAAPVGDEDLAWEALIRWRWRGAWSHAPLGLGHLWTIYGPLIGAPGRPFAVAHLAQSLDGRIATMRGASQWLSGEGDLLHTHRMRALADAVVVGAGTVAQDNPRLTVRRCTGPSPVRVVIDSERRLTTEFGVFRDGAAPTLLVVAEDRAAVAGRHGNAEIVAVPRAAQGLAPQAIRDALAAHGLRWLFVEGGGITISRFLAAGCLDRLQLAVAPLLLGSGRPSLTLPEVSEVCHGLRPRIRRIDLGEDLLYECIFRE